MSRVPRRPFDRAQAGVIAVALLAVTLLAGWHQASVKHSRCVEHGEELHLSPIAAPLAVRAGDQAEIAASPWAAVEGDTHCEILATAHQPFHAHAAATLEAAPAALDTATPPPPPIVAIAAAIYRLAPKTSPPVA